MLFGGHIGELCWQVNSLVSWNKYKRSRQDIGRCGVECGQEGWHGRTGLLIEFPNKGAGSSRSMQELRASQFNMYSLGNLLPSPGGNSLGISEWDSHVAVCVVMVCCLFCLLCLALCIFISFNPFAAVIDMCVISFKKRKLGLQRGLGNDFPVSRS